MMDMSSIFHDRRPAPEPESGLVEVPEGVQQDPEREVIPEQMSEDMLIDSIRVPSAHPGPGTMVMGRARDKDLCVHCDMPLISHGTGVFEHHAPKRRSVPRTPGVSADVDSGRSRNGHI